DFVDLDHYVAEPIPEPVLRRIQEAKTCGVTEFSVCYPVFRKAESDPIVVGKLGTQMVLVGRWGNEEPAA
ncbi:MAG: hypothetical protein AAB368_13030, partial [bacterium]